ncbi:hypothetical protein BGX38DRAFT_1277225 [Terfezia claveryi]|nr:hypothetical protein BGX38DRAFT_1277225 [Terfezia claveryi]
MSAFIQYPPHVQVANTYYYPGYQLGATSDADITALASQMRAARIQEQQAQQEKHEFLLQYQIPRSALSEPFSDPTMLPGIQATPAQALDTMILPDITATSARATRHRRTGTPHPAAHRRAPYPPSQLPTPPNSPTHQSTGRNEMPPPIRPYLMENRSRYNPEQRGTAKEQRKRRAAQRETINAFGGENGRRLLHQFWAAMPRQVPLQPIIPNVPTVNPVQAVTDGLSAMGINSYRPVQMYTVPAPARRVRGPRRVFPDCLTQDAPVVEDTKINDTDDEMELDVWITEGRKLASQLLP